MEPAPASLSQDVEPCAATQSAQINPGQSAEHGAGDLSNALSQLKLGEQAFQLEDLPELVLTTVLSFLPWPAGIAALLANKRFKELGEWALKAFVREQKMATLLAEGQHYRRVRAQLPPNTKSTIALAFSSDCATLASTHGDHTVKLVDILRSRRLATLVGHPRTPWTVKFHPSRSHIVASGCLGGDLRIWDARTQQAINHATLPHPVISLSFHPDGSKLAAAAGSLLYLWDFTRRGAEPTVILQAKASLRCIRFIDARRLLVGVRSRGNNSGMTSYIRAARAQLLLYSYDDGKFEHQASSAFATSLGVPAPPSPSLSTLPPGPQSPSGFPNAADESLHESCLSEPVVIVRRALLYNDAGLDVTADKRSVLTCAEFWVQPPTASLDGAAPAPHVPGSLAEPLDRQDETEDEHMEQRGFERVAHLIRVSLFDGSSSLAATPHDASACAPRRPPSQGHGALLSRASLRGLWEGMHGGTFVTSVKLSPTGAFVLLGCSRGHHEGSDHGQSQHPVAAVWRLGDMARMGTLACAPGEEDDANVALFHPVSGAGVVYGTKQGQVACALSTDELDKLTLGAGTGGALSTPHEPSDASEEGEQGWLKPPSF